MLMSNPMLSLRSVNKSRWQIVAPVTPVEFTSVQPMGETVQLPAVSSAAVQFPVPPPIWPTVPVPPVPFRQDWLSLLNTAYRNDASDAVPPKNALASLLESS